MTTAAIHIESLGKSFGSHHVLQGIDLTLKPGETLALLGRNGEGKTTTIKTLLGLLLQDTGRVEVLGLDPAKEALAIRQRVGYLAEDQSMWPWMRVEEIVRFMGPFYPTWDHDLAKDLIRRFELSPRQRIRHLSKGQTVRLGLVLALAHRPRLAILDDPALGLDPVARKQFNHDLVVYLQEQGVAVFYSSHLLGEVEAVSDRIAILHHGKIIVDSTPEALRDRIKQLVIGQDIYQQHLAEQPDILSVEQHGEDVAVIAGDTPAMIDRLASHQVRPHVIDLNLDAIFEAYVVGRRDTVLSSTALAGGAA